MILGIGTDLCRTERIARAIENPRFTARIYTPAENARLAPLGPERRAERAAGIFAAKEAVSKALGTGFSGFGFADIEILADENGRPFVRLYGKAAALAGNCAVHISISHDGGLAQAFAVIETKGGA